MGRILTLEDVEFAIKGGSVYAAGGGGWADHGRMLGTAAVSAGQPELVSMDEVEDDAWIATAAAIGAPAGTTAWQMLGVDYVNAVRLLQERLGAPVYGLMVGQNGKSSTMNGWLPAAVLGCKVIDAVGDLRAHPTGDMGSIGMANSPTPMIQTAVGGNRDNNSYIELVIEGATAKVSPVLRTASDMSGGFIASCRNPLRASYVREHAALGGISMALNLGQAITDAEPKGGSSVIDAICAETKGTIAIQGKVIKKDVVYTKEAFDIGIITVDGGDGLHTLHVMNEYMALDGADGSRISTYPDVLSALDMNGHPLSVSEVSEGLEIAVLHVAKSVIPLSSSVIDPAVYPSCERAMGIELARYALAD